MIRRALIVVAVCCLLAGRAAWAHRIDEYLQATILSLATQRADASMRLIPGVIVAPSVIAAIDTNHDGVFSENEKKAYAERVVRDLSLTADGQPVKAKLDAWFVPEISQLRGGLGEIKIQYHVDLPSISDVNRTLILENHHLNAGSVYLVNVEVPQDLRLSVVDQKRNQQQSVYELDYKQMPVAAAAFSSRSDLRTSLNGLQFTSLFYLGMRHIAEGTDHLLFLLVLLLPAPLLTVGPRWKATASVRQTLLRIAAIVTAFTIGHSLTLTLAAMNVLRVPSRPIEVLIAVSILVSAVHALRPIFPGREAWIAAFFGLIHGLAFAATLDRLGLSGWSRVAGILSFNLGIEAMQLIVVAMVLPSLLLLSRTSVYPILRIVGAVFACAASTAWIAERLLSVHTSVDACVSGIARTGVWDATGLFVVSLVCVLITALRSKRVRLKHASTQA